MAIDLRQEAMVEELTGTPLRVLVERYPELLPLLAGYGLDLCCGGAHTLPEAAHAHELDGDALLDAALFVVEQAKA